MDSKHFFGPAITSVAAALALGIVTLPVHAADAAEFVRQLDQTDGVKNGEAPWSNTSRELSSSPPYGNENAVSVPGSATDASRAGPRERTSDTLTTPSDATTSAPTDSLDPARDGAPLKQPKYQ
jgi:hypothetical protein